VSRTAELVVGIDLGTTDTKAVLTTPDGTTVGFARGATSWTQREGGRLETTGAALTGDVIATVSEALGDNHRRKHPRLTFCGVDEPGARGAALFAACAALDVGVDELAPRFAATADPPGTAARSGPAPDRSTRE